MVKVASIITFLKKINNTFIDIINFLLLLPVYFFGVGLCRILWELFGKKYVYNKNNSYWINSEKINEDYDEYTKQF